MIDRKSLSFAPFSDSSLRRNQRRTQGVFSLRPSVLEVKRTGLVARADSVVIASEDVSWASGRDEDFGADG